MLRHNRHFFALPKGSCAGAFIVPDLAGDAVHGEANPVHIEGDRSRGKVGFAPRLEAMALARANGVQLLERECAARRR